MSEPKNDELGSCRTFSVSHCAHCGRKHAQLTATPTGSDTLGAYDCWSAKCPATGKALYYVFADLAERRRLAAKEKNNE